MFSKTLGHIMYLEDRFGTPAPQPRRSRRENKGKYDVDPIDEAAGERYRALDDEVMRLQRTKAIEEPGVLAGFSHVTGLPKLLGGLVIRNKGYAYAPLVRRMDNDRLDRAIRGSSLFSDV